MNPPEGFERFRGVRGSAPGLRSLLARGAWEEAGRAASGAAIRRYRVSTSHGEFYAWRADPPGLLARVAGRDPGRAVKLSWTLRRSGVQMPEVLGYFSDGAVGLLVTEWIPGIRKLIDQAPGGSARSARKTAWFAGLQVGHLHSCRVSIEALEENIYTTDDPKRPVVLLGVEQCARLTEGNRISALTRLKEAASGTGLARWTRVFASAYFKKAGLSRKQAVKIMKRLAK